MSYYGQYFGNSQRIAGRLQLPKPATLVGNTDQNATLIRDLLSESIIKIRNEYAWPELYVEYTITLATGVDAYLIPFDLYSVTSLTEWNRTQKWPLVGPLSPQDWQLFKSGQIASLPHQRFRVKGFATNQFFIDPTPTASENGQTCVLEYQTKTCIRPRSWLAGQTYSANTYTFYNGNFYFTLLGGITGSTAPTHTSGTVSDGTVLWLYLSAVSTNLAYDIFLADTDVVILDNTMIEDRTVWRFKEERGLSFVTLKETAEQQKESAKTNLTGAKLVTVNQKPGTPPMIGLANYPIGSYGI